MTGKSSHPSSEPYEPNAQDGEDFVTRADLKAQEKPTEPPKLVTLSGPSGTTVKTTEENAEVLREHGYK
jgi:hypothetical protein